ncbi:calcium/sodium antiporter [Endozoicomonas arenosclerae]|uniref:calcium/sodium antiporter n=1 Tax=Endozoicomonas arenosclerae TaxID=1633495 RepID=UPI001294689C|nr:calcium/sodium antiporter [Endozoicomonas arenosclerae]
MSKALSSIHMIEILSFVAAIAVGFVVLSWSADRLIEVASTLASRLGMSILTIGMTIVAFGTSAPELLVSSVAALDGSAGIAIGNALGSNIINIGLVLALCGVIYPLVVSRRIITRELPLLGLVVVFSLALMLDGDLSQTDGFILAGALVAYCYYLAKHSGGDSDDDEEVVILSISTARAVIESLVLLALLMGSSKLLVWGASELARSFGISEVVIGLTVIAFGTSLPEMAAALASARKGLFDLVMATVIGSNIFNLLGVLAFPGILSGGLEIDPIVMQRDGLAMAGLTALLAIFVVTSLSMNRNETGSSSTMALGKAVCSRIPRYKSALILVAFAGYMAVLAISVIN